ncbi:hypothetical protein [Streptomyces sp. MBT33]|uniref:hypothetical protein n=1 Tax=Streptomyces sp. MBT33 TaxID=1488363 RepID=UPI00190AD2DD|nr:hypothetical protein [Streptomyces sp. MBT33]MBK3643950.1 hypothetical protein [Streptomyces sp. MBT33]
MHPILSACSTPEDRRRHGQIQCRSTGHQVADKGNPAKKVLDAYDAAHRTTNLAEAS